MDNLTPMTALKIAVELEAAGVSNSTEAAKIFFNREKSRMTISGSELHFDNKPLATQLRAMPKLLAGFRPTPIKMTLAEFAELQCSRSIGIADLNRILIVDSHDHTVPALAVVQQTSGSATICATAGGQWRKDK